MPMQPAKTMDKKWLVRSTNALTNSQQQIQ